MTSEHLQVFAEEAEDLLRSAESALLNLDDLDNEQETLECVNDLFRTFHTIKGAAGLFGLDAIVDFTHVVESVLGKIREGSLSVTEDMTTLFLYSRDHLEKLVSFALSGVNALDEETENSGKSLLSKLNLYITAQKESSDFEHESIDSTPTTVASRSSVENENWHISLRFGLHALQNGMDPASFIGYLSTLGELKRVLIIEDGFPAWESYEPEHSYLGFELELSSNHATKDSIEEVFEFVQDDCRISILSPHSEIESYIKLIEDLPEEPMRIGDILVACGALTEREKDDVLNVQDRMVGASMSDASQPEVLPLGAVAVNEQVVQQAVVDAAIKKQEAVNKNKTDSQQTIRVNAHKLENLINLVGELVIGSANSELNARRLADSQLNEAMENLSRLVEEVRDTALGLRMVQIGETFNRFKRVVREVSRELGKSIDLRISGAETELDKTLIEKIGDPLMHLVRNAIDHGIESPEQRLAEGKPEVGVVNLDAFHDSGSIVIRISDDGKGLSREKILSKAIEKGLVSESASLNDQEVYRLIFEPGFSTADEVSNLSGRGVGMDVVRRNIESLRGQVELESEVGLGSTISIRLPLTLAIIDGFQVRVGDAQYIVPLDMVEECIELNESLRGGDANANYVNLRGEILPYMHLNEVFGVARKQLSRHRDNIVVVQFAGKKAGFVVDELLGEHQTVIKPLGKIFQNLKGISGATILGSGEVAMIIDIPEMVNRVENHDHGSRPERSVH
jgi:two-component system chemotaxis sensor kinase CheA